MPLRVLVADDNRLFSEAVAALLQSDTRLEVVGCAANGAEAVDFADKLDPDLVLMDIRMPVMDGIEATSRILARRPATKIAVATAQASSEEIELAFTAGAVSCLAKEDFGLHLVEYLVGLACGDDGTKTGASFAARGLP